MKLLYCNNCNDIFELPANCTERHCQCYQSKGRYVSVIEWSAEYSGPCVPIGFNSKQFVHATRNQPENEPAVIFEAFVIPKNCRTFRRTD